MSTAADWSEIRQRLDNARTALERTLAPIPELVARTLKARAEALAREPAKAEAADTVEAVVFRLAHETYAVEARYVREVSRLENLTPLPCTPAFVLGVVNLRGQIVSVIDMRKFFALPEKGLSDLNRVIVLRSEEMAFGLLADAIVGVGRIARADIQPSLPTLTGIREKYLQGVTREGVVVLDAARLLADERIVVREQAKHE
jgi:purine-binding chemotaxis protein CheW